MTLRAFLSSFTALLLLIGSTASMSAEESERPTPGWVVGGEPGFSTEEISRDLEDAWLHGKLESLLLFNAYLDPLAIDSDVEDGVATLKGYVETDVQRDLAGELAIAVSGIESVDNQLIVDPSRAGVLQLTPEQSKALTDFRQRVADATLTARLKGQFLVTETTPAIGIDIETEDGVVTLSGVVDSEPQRELMIQMAENMDDVKSVTDRLVVQTGD